MRNTATCKLPHAGVHPFRPLGSHTRVRVARRPCSTAVPLGSSFLVDLPDTQRLEVLMLPRSADSDVSSRPPMLFVHGSGHAAWCWMNFMPFFQNAGFEVFAVSMRGHVRPRPVFAAAHDERSSAHGGAGGAPCRAVLCCAVRRAAVSRPDSRCWTPATLAASVHAAPPL